MEALTKYLIDEGVVASPDIIAAFDAVRRKDFVPAESAAQADVDEPCGIGSGQTISQPTTVAFMLELLQPRAGDVVLDVGTGSGWLAALLAFVVGPRGKVTSVEIRPELVQLARKNLARYSFAKLRVVVGDATAFAGANAYDRIVVSAAMPGEPAAFKRGLKIGGRLVVPVTSAGGQDIILYEKKGPDEYAVQRFPGFVFVPFI